MTYKAIGSKNDLNLQISSRQPSQKHVEALRIGHQESSRMGGPVSQEPSKHKARFTESAVSSRQFGSFWPCLQPEAILYGGGGKDL